MEVPVGLRGVHFLPEGQHLAARDHRILVAMADEDARTDPAGLGREAGVEQAVEAGHREQRRAVAGELERGLPTHAEADRGELQVFGHGQRGESLSPALRRRR
jgi:hypothetical protein